MSAVLLLGGRSAIGLAVVEHWLAVHPGRDVVLAQRGGGPVDPAVERSLRAAGAADVSSVDFDAMALEDHERVVGEVFDTGRVDCAVVAFGILGDQERAWTEVAAAQRMLQVNATAAVGVGVALAARMRAQGGGDIVAISSVAGTRVRRSNFVYGASKQAMDSFYLNLATVLRGTGVRVLVVRPGAITSPMTQGRPPVAFTRQPGDVGRAAVAALSAGRTVVHVPAGFGPAMWLARLVPERWWSRLRA